MTAGAANNDPLILYAVAILILGGLIGYPYLLKFVKRKRNAMIHKNGEKETNNTDSSVKEFKG